MAAYSFKGALRVLADSAFPELDTRKSLKTRRYCLRESYSDMLGRYGNVVNISPVLDRQLKNDFIGQGGKSFCLRFKFTSSELVYEGQEREPWVGGKLLPPAVRSVVVQDLNQKDKELLISSWNSDATFEDFMALAGSLGTRNIEQEVVVLSMLQGAERLAYVTGRSRRPDTIPTIKDPDAQPA